MKGANVFVLRAPYLAPFVMRPRGRGFAEWVSLFGAAIRLLRILGIARNVILPEEEQIRGLLSPERSVTGVVDES